MTTQRPMQTSLHEPCLEVHRHCHLLQQTALTVIGAREATRTRASVSFIGGYCRRHRQAQHAILQLAKQRDTPLLSQPLLLAGLSAVHATFQCRVPPATTANGQCPHVESMQAVVAHSHTPACAYVHPSWSGVDTQQVSNRRGKPRVRVTVVNAAAAH